MNILRLFFILSVVAFVLPQGVYSLPAPIPTIDPTNYNNVKNNITDYDMLGTMGAVWGGYISLMGYLINLFLLLLIFSMFWIRQGHIGLPTVIGLMFAGVFIAMIPAQYQLYATVLIGIGGFAFMLKLISERK